MWLIQLDHTGANNVTRKTAIAAIIIKAITQLIITAPIIPPSAAHLKLYI
jgi:hypothetical protein